MDRHRRMARTLACLVASMTLGAAILHWGHPVPSTTAPTGTDLIALHIRRAIQPSAQGGEDAPRWSAIRIHPRDRDVNARAADTHFVIDEFGRWSWTQSWRGQRRLGSPGIVQIGLLAADRSHEVTQAQKRAADNLIRVLRDEYSIPARGVAWHEALAVPPVALPVSCNRSPAFSGSVAAR